LLKDLIHVKAVIFTLFIIFHLIPGQLHAQDEPETIRQFRKTVFQLQQQMLELKDDFDRQKKELLSQRQSLTIQIEQLKAENSKLKKQVLELDSLLFQLEDRLESSSIIKLGKQVENLRDFNLALILDRLNHSDQAEKLLLDIINQPGTSLPKDLLILMLAQQKRRDKSYDDSLSYYSTLLAEFLGSSYFSQGIYEMSEVLAEMGRIDQQLTLLSQLAAFSKTDKYSLMAAAKLRELGEEPIETEEEAEIIAEKDATTDTPSTEMQKKSIGFVEEPAVAAAGIIEDADATADVAIGEKAKEDSQSEEVKTKLSQDLADSKELSSDATNDNDLDAPLFPQAGQASQQKETQVDDPAKKIVEAVDTQEEINPPAQEPESQEIPAGFQEAGQSSTIKPPVDKVESYNSNTEELSETQPEDSIQQEKQTSQKTDLQKEEVSEPNEMKEAVMQVSDPVINQDLPDPVIDTEEEPALVEDDNESIEPEATAPDQEEQPETPPSPASE